MNDTTMKAPAPNFQYPTTMDGRNIEYGSVIITLDHLSAGRENDPHIHSKFVFSTQDEVESALANFAYFGEVALAINPTVTKLLGEMFTKDYPIIVYNPAPNTSTGFQGCTQIILAMDTFIEAINNSQLGDGSILMTVERLVQMVGQTTRDKLAGQPEGARLPVFGLELENLDADTPTE